MIGHKVAMNPIKHAWHILTRPVTEEPSGALREYMLGAMLVSMAILTVVATLLSLYGLFRGTVPADTVIILGAMEVLFVLGWFISKMGGWKISRYIPIVLFMIAAVYGNYVGGMGAPAMLLYIIAITVTATLFSGRAQYAVIFICVVFFFGMAFLHHRGIIVAVRTDESAFYNRVIIAGSAILCIGILLRFLLNQLERSLKVSRERETELAATNEELQATIEELEATNEEFEAQNEELVRMNYELEESENYNRVLFSDSSVPIVVLDPETRRFTDCNNAAVKVYALASRDELIGLTPVDVSAPVQYDGTDSAIAVGRVIARARAEGSYLFEWRHRRRDGTEWDAEVHLMSFSFRGKPMMQFTLQDITERRRAELVIRESEATLKSLLNATPAGVGKLVDRVFKEANETLSSITGYAREELIGKNSRFLYFDEKEYQRVADEIYGEMRSRGVGIGEALFRHKDGSMINVYMGLAPFDPDNYDGAISFTLLDISERKSMERAIRDREERYRAFISKTNEGVWCWDIDEPFSIDLPEEEQVRLIMRGRISEANDAIARLYGFIRAEEMIGRSFGEFMTEEEFSGMAALLVESRFNVSNVESYEMDRDGNRHYFINNSIGIVEDGRLIRIWGTHRDVTQRRLAELELLGEKQFSEKLLESLPGIFFLYDSTCHLKRWNKAHETTMGFTEDELRDWYIPDWHETPEDAEQGMELVKTVLETGVGGVFETTLINKEGAFVPYLLSINRLETPGGPFMMGVGIDLTERIRAETALKESEGALRSILDAAPVGVGLLLNRLFKQVNSSLCRMTGYTEEELLGQLTRILYPDDEEYEKVSRELYADMRRHKVGMMEVRLQRKNGEIFPVLLGLAPFDPDNIEAGICATVLDITDRKRAEEALKESERVLRSIFDATPVGIAMVVDRRFKQVNTASCTITGYAEGELINQSLRMVYADDDEFERIGRELYGEMLRTGLGAREARMRRKNGEIFSGFVSIAPVDPLHPEAGVCAILMDITERKRAEDAIRETEERFRLMADSAPVMIGMSDQHGKVVYFNRTWREFLGISSDDETSIGWMHGVHPEDIDPMRLEIRKKVQAKEPYRVQYRMKRHDGEYRWVLNTAVPRYSAEGQYYGYIGIALDITERIEFEERISSLNLGLEKKVNERTEELRRAYEDIVKTNRDLESTLHNLHDTQHQLVQSEKLAALGQLAAGMAHELNTPLGAIISSNHSIVDLIQRGLPMLADRITRWNKSEINRFGEMMALNLAAAVTLEHVPNREIKREIRKFVEESGISEGRTLADAIADLGLFEYVRKNPSVLKLGDFGEILDTVSFISSVRNLGEIISIAADKATHVVGALRSYLRQDDPGDIAPVDIKAELDMILTLYHNKLKYGITVTRNYDEAGFVLGNRNNLNQVWMNLLNNALQAMEYKGDLGVSAEKRGEWTLVSITDSGPGIPDDIRDRIFEPFFTTKRYGEGIGLGLDICNKIVEALGGRIEYNSVPGKTVFRVWLKAVERGPA